MRLDGKDEEQNIKEYSMRVRMDESLKNSFFETCEKQCSIPSRVVRRLIYEFVEKHKE
ncbi:MAG: CopG family transcriptional regulator [Acidaminococcaceae bacterium]